MEDQESARQGWAVKPKRGIILYISRKSKTTFLLFSKLMTAMVWSCNSAWVCVQNRASYLWWIWPLTRPLSIALLIAMKMLRSVNLCHWILFHILFRYARSVALRIIYWSIVEINGDKEIFDAVILQPATKFRMIMLWLVSVCLCVHKGVPPCDYCRLVHTYSL